MNSRAAPPTCGTTDLNAHALCFSHPGHALLSAARRFVRSTQNIEAIAAQLSARRTSGSLPIRRAASGVSDRQSAAAMHSMHSAARARRTSPQAPGDPPWRHVKNNAFPCILKGFGRKPSNYQRPGPRRQLVLVGVSWRRLIHPYRKLQHFGPARWRLGALKGGPSYKPPL